MSLLSPSLPLVAQGVFWGAQGAPKAHPGRSQGAPRAVGALGLLAWAALLGARARKLAPVGGTSALVGRMRAPPAPTCAPLSPTCAPRCASERRSGMLMLVVVRPSGGVVVLVISKKAPRPEWLFPLPEWLGVAPSGSEWLGVAPAGAWPPQRRL